MTIVDEIHLHDIGTDIIVNLVNYGVPVDVSAFENIAILIGKPSGEVVELAGSFVTDGTNGQVHTVTASDIFDELGNHTAQVVIFNDDGVPIFHSQKKIFRVISNVGEPTLPGPE